MPRSVRRPVLALLGLVLGGWLAAPAAAGKVMVLLSRSAEPYLIAARGLQHVAKFEVQFENMEGDADHGRQWVKALDAGGTTALVAVGTEAGQAARGLDPGVPLVYTMVMEPLDVPGRRSTGVVIKLDTAGQFQRLQKLFPTKKRVGVIYNPGYSSRDIEEARRLAPRYELELIPLAVEKSEEVSAALPKLGRGAVDLIWMVPDKTVAQLAAVQALIAHAQQEGIPLIGLSMYHVKSGALAAFSVDFADIGEQTAALTQRVIADGGYPPVEPPRKVIIYVNPKVQKQLGLEDLSVFPEVNFVE